MSESASTHAVGYEKPGYIISTDPTLLDVPMIHHYLSEQSYWAKGITREKVIDAIENSLCFGVYIAEALPLRQVGFARAITDYSTYAYMADVFILPDFQGRGLGKWLVAEILAHPDLQTLRRWTLRTDDAHELYRRFGFETEQDLPKTMHYCPQ